MLHLDAKMTQVLKSFRKQCFVGWAREREEEVFKIPNENKISKKQKHWLCVPCLMVGDFQAMRELIMKDSLISPRACPLFFF